MAPATVTEQNGHHNDDRQGNAERHVSGGGIPWEISAVGKENIKTNEVGQQMSEVAEKYR